MEDLILEASELMAQYNPAMADKFIKEPFNRLTIARAFSCGFVKNPEDDAPEFCYTIVEVALLDQRMRKVA